MNWPFVRRGVLNAARLNALGWKSRYEDVRQKLDRAEAELSELGHRYRMVNASNQEQRQRAWERYDNTAE